MPAQVPAMPSVPVLAQNSQEARRARLRASARTRVHSRFGAVLHHKGAVSYHIHSKKVLTEGIRQDLLETYLSLRDGKQLGSIANINVYSGNIPSSH